MTGRHPLNLVSTATTAFASLLVLAWPPAPAVASVSTPHEAPAAVATATGFLNLPAHSIVRVFR